MKKYLLLIFIIILGCLFGCTKSNVEEINNYCYKINNLIKGYEFYTAKVEQGEIILYDNEFQEIMNINFEEYNPEMPMISIRKENDNIYYITNGAVDDEAGIVFFNSDTNNILDGIKSLKRIGGNSYQYNTSD